MSVPSATQQSLLLEVEALVAALMGDVGRLEAAAGQGTGVSAATIDEVRNAIGLVRNGQRCAAVSALLSARSALRRLTR